MTCEEKEITSLGQSDFQMKYEKYLNDFLLSEKSLIKVDTPLVTRAKRKLETLIDNRDLENDIKVSLVNKILYLEKVSTRTYSASNLHPIEITEKHSRRITDAVRHEVWRRDEGRCVRCGSRKKLEYDHIIPVSLGGNNTVRNIELLCESCNREKSNKI